MINVKVSEGYAFDYLAILQIKCEIDPKKNFGNFAACVTNMIDEIDDNVLWSTIMDSVEYKKLYEVNRKTFEAVEDAKEDGVPASYVDKCNYERYLAKVDLQERFFPEEKITERKIGYNGSSNTS